MMLRFQEDTLRHLFRMQIIGPDGTPIESLDQLPPGFGGFAPPASEPANVIEASAQGSIATAPAATAAEHTPVPIQTRAPSTTIDALEREFQKKKQRELDQARAVGTATATNGNAPRVTGDKVGRNDPCPCGSGKKFKKCHGAEA
jgi:preprotein translocase subunit SecA